MTIGSGFGSGSKNPPPNLWIDRRNPPPIANGSGSWNPPPNFWIHRRSFAIWRAAKGEPFEKHKCCAGLGKWVPSEKHWLPWDWQGGTLRKNMCFFPMLCKGGAPQNNLIFIRFARGDPWKSRCFHSFYKWGPWKKHMFSKVLQGGALENNCFREFCEWGPLKKHQVP